NRRSQREQHNTHNRPTPPTAWRLKLWRRSNRCGLLHNLRHLIRCTDLGLAQGKSRLITSLGNINTDSVRTALTGVILPQPAAKPPRFYPHRRIDRWIVFLATRKDIAAEG